MRWVQWSWYAVDPSVGEGRSEDDTRRLQLRRNRYTKRLQDHGREIGKQGECNFEYRASMIDAG